MMDGFLRPGKSYFIETIFVQRSRQIKIWRLNYVLSGGEKWEGISGIPRDRRIRYSPACRPDWSCRSAFWSKSCERSVESRVLPKSLSTWAKIAWKFEWKIVWNFSQLRLLIDYGVVKRFRLSFVLDLVRFGGEKLKNAADAEAEARHPGQVDAFAPLEALVRHFLLFSRGQKLLLFYK